MKEKGILFSAPMVRAILDNRKTQTRRIVKSQPLSWHRFTGLDSWGATAIFEDNEGDHPAMQIPVPLQAGMRVYVKETFRFGYNSKGGKKTIYRADDPEVWGAPWKPSIFMPKALARIWLEIVAVRVERLQNISEDDAKAEGIDTSVTHPSPTGVGAFRAKNYVFAKEAYADLWRYINGPGSWDLNPWVWVYTFKRIER